MFANQQLPLGASGGRSFWPRVSPKETHGTFLAQTKKSFSIAATKMMSLKQNASLLSVGLVRGRLRGPVWWAVSSALALMLIVFSVTGAWAHGGEDHGESQPQTTATATELSHLARGGDLEILLKHAPIAPDQVTTARLFLSRYATNEPVGRARITLRLVGPTSADAVAKESRTAGQYELELPPLPQGAYRLSARVEAEGERTEVDLGSLEIAPATSAVTDALSASRFFVSFAVLTIAAAGALLLFAWRTAGRKKEAAAV